LPEIIRRISGLSLDESRVYWIYQESFQIFKIWDDQIQSEIPDKFGTTQKLHTMTFFQWNLWLFFCVNEMNTSKNTMYMIIPFCSPTPPHRQTVLETILGHNPVFRWIPKPITWPNVQY
jgi:hypothetical protein